ncbi:hypothetical protein F5Y08DRAFT_99879 [Xylaria arbuscula]|uniref:N-acetyltransferase domain-containing protein n=1 Tax=Xylaria arbuscula TaxID=114810 RepID=A0A9W8N808_9PEZI|nr:hypothetical protein F5Y08DRAFT_99879 [Xylaria arbuscula]KAJ3562242.1 hypothetical protein NPX13_g8638 [Xylaria arbuscula]
MSSSSSFSSSSSTQSAPPPSDTDTNHNDDESHDSHDKTNANGNGSADNVQPAISASDDAIDDTEDLSDDDADAHKRKSCERRRPQKSCIQDILPFPYSPLVRPLTISDLDSCVALENAAFSNPAHRCSRDKFIYRLTACPELCMGLFCTVAPSKTEGWDIDTLQTAHVVETGRDDAAVSVLLAHIVATRSHDNVVTDNSMAYPQGGNITETTDESKLGHQQFGRTVCIHSLAVHPKLQGVGMGKLILKSYLQQVKQADIADRIVLICREYLINYYKRWGFLHNGPSQTKLANGGWHDMTLSLASSE